MGTTIALDHISSKVHFFKAVDLKQRVAGPTQVAERHLKKIMEWRCENRRLNC